MVMGTAAKFISRRLFSSARNFTEKAKTVENLYRKAESHDILKAQLLLEKVQLLSTETKFLVDCSKRVFEKRDSIKDNYPIMYSTLFGSTCVMLWYYGKKISKAKKELASSRKKRRGAGATS